MKLRCQSFLLLGGFTLCLSTISPTQAQVSPDATLPSPSLVTENNNTNFVITGGTQAGSNLFHSFSEFSVPDGGSASFQQINQGIANVISRVTGSSVSNINGSIRLLQANGNVSSANLFLINPNGIIFGPNAALNLGGSFVASTASSIQFADGSEFSAANPSATPLLTVNVPIGLQFNGTEGNIVLRVGSLSSNTVTEVGDAGQLLDTAQTVNSQPSETPINAISGTLSNDNDVDLYQIRLTPGQTSSATTVRGTAVDTQLFLFK